MIRIYKGNIVYINKVVNGNSFRANVKLFYRYGWFKILIKNSSIKLKPDLTITDVYNGVKDVVDELDRVFKLK